MMREYEVVTLEAKQVVGLQARTSNLSPDTPMVIGGLWNTFYGKNIYQQIEPKKSPYALGIYSGYESDAMGAYDITVACEVKDAVKLPEGTVSFTIPAGKYARFRVEGDVQKDVAKLWEEIWKMDLPRAYTYDFEEYLTESMDQAIVDVYIALK